MTTAARETHIVGVPRRGPRRSGALASVACALSAAFAFGEPGVTTCFFGAGPCFEAHAGPGCDSVACCALVCDAFAFCCESAWDEFCAEIATLLCADIVCPQAGSCFAAHDGPGCDDESCCNLTCRFDPYCCSSRWDGWCAEQAAKVCGSVPCELAIPPEAFDENELCTERINEGCNLPSAPVFAGTACGMLVTGHCATGAPRDTDWYIVTVPSAQQATFTLTSEFPAEMLLVRGPCATTSVHGRATAFNCAPGSLTAVVEPGEWFIVVSTAFEPRPIHRGAWCEDDDPKTTEPYFGNRYLLAMSCQPPPPNADLNGDGLVDGADLGLLLGQWGGPGSADLNGDGTVDGADLGLLLGAWSV